MHVYVYVHVYIYIYTFQCICIVQTTLLLDLGFHLFWKVPVSPEFAAKSLPHHLRRCSVTGKRGSAKELRANHLETPRFAKWMTDLSCSYRHANFQTNANPRMFKYIDVLAAEILGTIVWHICFHETRAIQAQESRLKGHRFHMFLYIILKKNKQSEPWNSSILGNKYPTYLESSHIHKRSKAGTFLPNTSGLWVGLQKTATRHLTICVYLKKLYTYIYIHIYT